MANRVGQKIKLNIYKSNPITSADKSSRLDDEFNAYSEIIKKNLELDIMYERYPFDREDEQLHLLDKEGCKRALAVERMDSLLPNSNKQRAVV